MTSPQRTLLAGLLGVSLLGGCAGLPWQDTGSPAPTPVEGPDNVSAPAIETPLQREDPPPALVIPQDSAGLAQAVADSAADVNILDQLATVLPPGGDPSDTSLEAFTEAGGLDLRTYADHPRVQFYLDFFRGEARPRMEVWLQRLPRYEPMVRERFEAEGLPGDLVYLGIIESGFSNVAVSRSRAVGMWQFMYGTARWIGLRVDRWVDERRDPVKATDAAARYLAYLTKQFGSTYLAAAAYNAGPGTVSRGLRRVSPVNGGPESLTDAEGVDLYSDADFFTLADTRYLRSETKAYIPKLIAASLIARNPTGYGFAPIRAVASYPKDSIVVPDMTGLDVIAELAGVKVDEIRELNPHFLRQATPPGTSAVVRLPAGTADRVAEGYAALPASKRVRYREHIVRKGETLGGIAQRYGVSVADLRASNRAVRNTNLIRINQVLVVPTIPGSSGGYSSPDPASRGATVHVVRRGETASGIADRYGVGLSRLIAWNGLPSSGLIRVGQRLVLQPPEGDQAEAAGESRTHLVRRGETLSAIADRYGVSVSAIMELNGIRSARQLQAGKRIKIPS